MNKYHDDGAAWREMPIAHLSAADLYQYALTRWDEGMDKHGKRFLGNPLEHLGGELIDAIRYAEMAEKWIYSLIAENAVLRERIAELEQEKSLLG